MRYAKIFLLIFTVILIVGCTKESFFKEKDLSKIDSFKIQDFVKVSLKTQDGVDLKGNFYEGITNKGVILLPMLNSNKESYNEFATLLKQKGYNVLSLDIRGHGESDLNWKDFQEKDFNDMVLDVKVARDFLVGEGIDISVLVGASIGANTVLNYAVTNKEIKKIVLLSPGLNYRGISIADSIKNYKNNILIVTSEKDTYSFESSKELFMSSEGIKKIFTLKNADHGTNVFKNKALVKDIIKWIDE